MSNSNTWKINLILTLVGLLLAIGISELAVWLVFKSQNPFELGEIEKWNPLDDSQFTPKLNALGFREEPLDEIVLGDTYTRILFLGDSFTFGQGIANGQDRFSDLIEKKLNSTSETKYHIYNASRPGTEPVDWLDFYRVVQAEYQPNHVFAIFFLRDGTDLCTSLRCYEDIINQIKEKYTNRFFYKYSNIGRFFYNQIIIQEFSDFYAEQIEEAYLGNENQTQTWQLQQEALRKIQNLCLANGSTFHLIIFPLLYHLDDNYPFYDVEAEIVQFADESNMPVFSLTSGFIGEPAEALWISANDQHPNEKGHFIATQTLLPYMMQVLNN